MTAPQGHTPQELAGLQVIDRDGQKVGTIQQVYLDDASGAPEWITVRTGLFGSKESFVPLSGAQRSEGQLQVPYAKEEIKGAPRVEADGHLEPSEEENLYRHYGMSMQRGGRTDTSRDTAGMAGMAGAGGMAGAAGGMGRPETADDSELAGAGMRGTHEMTRSEEKAYVDTEEYESGHARLHKHVVTEDVTTSVPLSHEEVRVTREPISPDERMRGGRTARIEDGDTDTEVTLHSERAVVRKETVPVERVRLDTEKVTEEQEVSTQIRKEEIDYENDEHGGKGMKDRGGPGDDR